MDSQEPDGFSGRLHGFSGRDEHDFEGEAMKRGPHSGPPPEGEGESWF